MKDDTKRQTLVFAYDTVEQRLALLALFPDWFLRTEGLRIVAASMDNEIKRVSLIEEAAERYSDCTDRQDAIDAVIEHPNLSKFKWEEYEDAA